MPLAIKSAPTTAVTGTLGPFLQRADTVHLGPARIERGAVVGVGAQQRAVRFKRLSTGGGRGARLDKFRVDRRVHRLGDDDWLSGDYPYRLRARCQE